MEKIPVEQAKAVNDVRQAVVAFYSTYIDTPIEVILEKRQKVIEESAKLETLFPKIAREAHHSLLNFDYLTETGDYKDALHVAFVKLAAFPEMKTFEEVASILPELKASLQELSKWCEGYEE